MWLAFLVSWTSSFTLFGFGEIIEDTKSIRAVLAGNNLPPDFQNKSEVNETAPLENEAQIKALQKQYENGDMAEDDCWKRLENLLKQQ